MFTVTKNEMLNIDSRETDTFLIPRIIMIENGGRASAELVRKLYAGAKSIFVLVGPGLNGGSGLVCARHLSNWGYDVVVATATTFKVFTAESIEELKTLEAMKISIREFPEHGEPEDVKIIINEVDVIIDALIGYDISGTPQAGFAYLINYANLSEKPIVSVDLPSGLEPDSGVGQDPTIQATITLALGAPIQGLLKPEATLFVGDLYLADITIPLEWYKSAGETESLFKTQSIVPVLMSADRDKVEAENQP